MSRSFFIYTSLRWLVGSVFLFSGLIKLNELPGFSLKLTAYLEGFSTDISRWFRLLLPYTLPLALVICLIEVGLGAALLVGWHMRWVLVALWCLTCFFTCLTFYTFWFNSMASCGCLGETIVLSPKQSFLKNILLWILLSFLYYQSVSFPFQGLSWHACMAWVGSLGVGIIFAWYSVYRFPLIDLSPYKVGVSIVQLTQPKEPLRYRYWVKKDGIVSGMESYPKEGGYRLVKKELLNPEARPQVKNFMIWNDERSLTEEILVGTQLLIVIRQPLADVTGELWDWLELINGITQPKSVIWLLPFELEEKQMPWVIPAHQLARANADLLRGLIPAPMGLLWLENGMIRGRWPYQSAKIIQQRLQIAGLYQKTNNASSNLSEKEQKDPF